MDEDCKFGKWTYSKIFEVTTHHCYRDTDPLGCYFLSCQEDCPNYEKKEIMTDDEIMFFNEEIMAKVNKRPVQPLGDD